MLTGRDWTASSNTINTYIIIYLHVLYGGLIQDIFNLCIIYIYVILIYLYIYISSQLPVGVSASLDFQVTCDIAKLLKVRTLLLGCLWWVAPPCSTWIFLSRGSTGRTHTRARGSKITSVYSTYIAKKPIPHV